MPTTSSSPETADTMTDQFPVTFGSFLADIRHADIPLWYADILVAAIRLRAYYPNGAGSTNPAQHPIIPPWDMNLTVPSGHELVQCNGFVFVQPIMRSKYGKFYIITRGKVVGVFRRWINTAPFVIGVSGAVFEKVQSSEQGIRLMMDTIDSNIVMYF